MGNSFVISGLRAKRARLAGEIIQAQEIVATRTKELLAIDAVIRLFTPDTDPEMIAPIRPSTRGLFFQYKELGRLCLDALRVAGKPMTLDQIAAYAMLAKGLPGDDGRLRVQVINNVRQSLMRQVQKGRVRRILDEPDMWWELVG
jgi:hypothetical protein